VWSNIGGRNLIFRGIKKCPTKKFLIFQSKEISVQDVEPYGLMEIISGEEQDTKEMKRLSTILFAVKLMTLNVLIKSIREEKYIKIKTLGKREDSLLMTMITKEMMPKNLLKKDEMRVRVLKLKNELFNRKCDDYSKNLAHEYLNRVLDIIEEYRY